MSATYPTTSTTVGGCCPVRTRCLRHPFRRGAPSPPDVSARRAVPHGAASPHCPSSARTTSVCSFSKKAAPTRTGGTQVADEQTSERRSHSLCRSYSAAKLAHSLGSSVWSLSSSGAGAATRGATTPSGASPSWCWRWCRRRRPQGGAVCAP